MNAARLIAVRHLVAVSQEQRSGEADRPAWLAALIRWRAIRREPRA